MTTMSQGNKKIATRKIPSTDNKVLFVPVVCTFSRNTGNQLSILVGTCTSTQDSSKKRKKLSHV